MNDIPDKSKVFDIPPSDTPAREYGFETLAVHAGARPDPVTGARTTPIFQTTAYVFDDAERAAELFNLQAFGFVYSRMTNPTVAVLEERVAALEGGRGAVASATGHSAQLLLCATLLQAGDEFIASRNLYGGSITQFGVSFPRHGWKCHFVDPTDPENFRRAMTDKVKFIFVENLANPGGIVVDVEKVAAIAHEHGIPLVCDNTLASPYLWRPMEWGVDIVTHSMTKYICGHGNTMGGIVIESGKFDWGQNDRFPGLSQPDEAYHGLTFYETFGDFGFTMKMRAVGLRDYGPTMSAQSAWNILQGVETLPLRMERHSENALAVANFLEGHPKVSWVSYPGLKSSPYYELGQKYMPKGCSSLFTFGCKGGYDGGTTVVDKVNMFSHLANLGDTRSLILHPASTTHRQLTEEQKMQAGAGPDVIRLSVGIESIDDIIEDLDQALNQT